MKYHVSPIYTVEDLDAALAAGAEGEFTAAGDAYDLPRYDPGASYSCGWVPSALHQWRGPLRPESAYAMAFARGNFRLRAFYPAP